MAHKIQFKGSDREATAEFGESVLEAAIRAGLNADYGCNNGNCGRCIARVLEGEVMKIRNYDYVQSAAEKANQEFLMCSHAPVSDLVLEAQVGDQAASIFEQCFRAKVRKITDAGDDVRILALQTPRARRLRFLAGQYAQLSGAGFSEVQCSIASCPCEERRLEFHVPRARGEFSDYVFGACRAGDELDVTAPFGHFNFSEDARRTAVFVAHETGFAPIKSLIEHVTGQEEEAPLHLCWITTSSGKPYLDNLCRAWNDAFDHFTYTPVTLDGGGGEALRACASRIAEICPGLPAGDAYVCAPPAVGDAVSQACLGRGLDPARLFRETMRGVHC